MKKFIVLFACMIPVLYTFSQSVGIGTNSPSASAQLDVQSNNKGMLVPRLTTIQRTAIASPAGGLMVYDTDTNGFWYYNGAAWTQLSTSGSSSNQWTTTGTNISNNNSGNVGIGMLAGSAKLSIAGNTNFFNAAENSGRIQPMGDSLVLNAKAGLSIPAPGTPGGDLLLQYATSVLERVGNVGIGIADPPEKLTVRGNLNLFNNTEKFASFTNPTGNNLQINAFTGSSLPAPGDPGGHIVMQFGNYSSLTNVGNVGMGTGTPEAKLHIATENAPTKLVLGRSHTSGGFTSLYMGTSALSNGYGYLQGVRSGGSAFGNVVLNEFGGNVGVGTNNPQVKLHVNGAGEALRVSNGNAGIQVSSDGFQFLNSSSVGRFYMSFFNDDFTISPSSGNNTGRLILNGNQVTVGQITPASGYLLSIGGKAICEELKVQLSGSWPDYVFKNNYKLRSFDELRNYIKQNNHLPNIPPAAELEKSGLELGDMQKRMMEKIEELTLYVLQLEEEIKKLKSVRQ